MSQESIGPDTSPAATAAPAPALGTGETGVRFRQEQSKTPNLGPFAIALKPPGSATGKKKSINPGSASLLATTF